MAVKTLRGWLGRTIAPPRFLLFLALFGAGLGVLVPGLGSGRGTMSAFDLAALVFLLSVVPLFASATAAQMRATAAANDANRAILLGLTAVTCAAILVAVASELAGRSDRTGTALVLATLVLAWLFSNMVYALHYAHVFYLDDGDGDARGLEFPSCDEPDYWDFLYFSATLGMTFQTSDVSITARSLRRVVTGHGLLAFVFNLGVLAFTINVLGG